MTNAVTKAQASEYDHIVLVDRSGSMGNASKRFSGKTRWQEAQEYISGLTAFLSDVDEDGITVIPFNGSVGSYDGLKSPSDIAKLFSELSPGGSTDLALAIRTAQKKREKSGKKTFIHVFTDGEPNSEADAIAAIRESVNTMKDDSDLAISILQIGDDAGATAFLRKLDDGLGLKFDAVNCLTAADSESLSYEQVMWLALND